MARQNVVNVHWVKNDKGVRGTCIRDQLRDDVDWLRASSSNATEQPYDQQQYQNVTQHPKQYKKATAVILDYKTCIHYMHLLRDAGALLATNDEQPENSQLLVYIVILESVLRKLRHNRHGGFAGQLLKLIYKEKDKTNDQQKQFVEFSYCDDIHWRGVNTGHVASSGLLTNVACQLAADHTYVHVSILCHSEQDKEELESAQTAGNQVHVYLAYQWFRQQWASVPAIQSLLDTIHSAHADVSSQKDTDEVYWTQADVDAGIERGTVHVGIYRTRGKWWSGSVLCNGVEIKVEGRKHVNRAIDGDTVAVHVLEDRDGNAQLAAAQSLLYDLDSDHEQDGQVLLGIGEEDAEKCDLEDRNSGGSLRFGQTGQVVCVLARGLSRKEIVITVADEDCKQIATGIYNKQVLVCTPLKVYFPLVRVRTKTLKHHIPTLQDYTNENLSIIRAVVKFVQWKEGLLWPDFAVVRVFAFENSIDRALDVTASIQALLVESGLEKQPFSLQALSQVPDPGNWAPTSYDFATRAKFDTTTSFIISVDPPGCTDVDDAFHVEFVEDSTEGIQYRVGVHIADVSHFVPQGSQLDLEARARGTTLYLVNSRHDMLPEALSANIASLLAGAPRLAFSVVWALDTDLNILSTWYGQSVIQSRYQLHYQQAQGILEGSEALADEGDTQQAKQTLALLERFADKLGQARRDAGAVQSESSELKFESSLDGKIGNNISSKQKVAMMDVVAELMIHTNVTVAQYVVAAFPARGIVRRHLPPKAVEQAAEAAEQICASLNVKMDTTSPQALVTSLDRAAHQLNNSSALSLLRGLITSTMVEAEYVCAGSFDGHNLRHYGLAVDLYSHFTSPIRRYADVLLHRQLALALELNGYGAGSPFATNPTTPTPMPTPKFIDADFPKNICTQDQVQQISEHLNKKTREARTVQRQCIEISLKHALVSRPVVQEALVYKIRPQTLTCEVFVPALSIRGILHITNKQNQIKLISQVKTNSVNVIEVEYSDPDQLSIRQLDQSKAQITIFDDQRDSEVVQLRPMSRINVHLSAQPSLYHIPQLQITLVRPSADIQSTVPLGADKQRLLHRRLPKTENKKHEAAYSSEAPKKDRYGWQIDKQIIDGNGVVFSLDRNVHGSIQRWSGAEISGMITGGSSESVQAQHYYTQQTTSNLSKSFQQQTKQQSLKVSDGQEQFCPKKNFDRSHQSFVAELVQSLDDSFPRPDPIVSSEPESNRHQKQKLINASLEGRVCLQQRCGNFRRSFGPVVGSTEMISQTSGKTLKQRNELVSDDLHDLEPLRGVRHQSGHSDSKLSEYTQISINTNDVKEECNLTVCVERQDSGYQVDSSSCQIDNYFVTNKNIVQDNISMTQVEEWMKQWQNNQHTTWDVWLQTVLGHGRLGRGAIAGVAASDR